MERVWVSVFLSLLAKTPDNTLKSVWRRESFLRSRTLVDDSFPTLGE